MPNVPMARDLGRVRSGPLGVPLSRGGSSLSQFGGVEAGALVDAGRAVGQVGGAAVDLMAQRQDERDALDVLNAMNAAEAQVNEYLIQGQSKRQLSQARGFGDETNTWLEEYGRKARERLPRRAHEAFTLKYADLAGRALNTAVEHEAKQFNNEKKALVETTYAAQLNRAAAGGAGDFDAAVREYELALTLGVADASERKRMRDAFVSEARLAQLDALSVDDPEAALAYYDAHEQDIAGVERAGARRGLGSLRATLEKDAREAVAMNLADAAMQVADTQTNAEEYIRAQVDGGRVTAAEAEKAISDVRARFQSRDEDLSRGDRDALRAARSIGGDPALWPATIRARLTESGDLERMETAWRERQRGADAVTDAALFFGLKSMAAGVDASDGSQRPELVAEFKDLDILRFVEEGRLSQPDANKLLELQLEARKGPVSEDKRRAIKTDSFWLDRLYKSVGVETGGKKPADPQLMGQVASRFRDAVDGQKKTLGRELTDEEYGAIVNRLAFMPTNTNPAVYLIPGVGREPVVMDDEDLLVNGSPLRRDVAGAIGQALEAAGARGSSENIRELAEIATSVGLANDGSLTQQDYVDLWRAGRGR